MPTKVKEEQTTKPEAKEKSRSRKRPASPLKSEKIKAEKQDTVTDNSDSEVGMIYLLL